jgi:NAD(P)H-flavin reductase
LEELENKFPRRFRVFYLLDNPPKEWVGNTGYVTEELLKAALPKDGNVKIFVCGYVSDFLYGGSLTDPLLCTRRLVG